MFISSLMFDYQVGYCHPHQYVETFVKIHIEKEGLTGFELKWIFDEMTSTVIMMDYDLNGDEVLDETEIAEIRSKLFNKLADSNFLVYIFVGEKDFPVRVVEQFNAEFLNYELIFEFFVPCKVPAIAETREVRLSVFDEEYYTLYEIDEESVTLNHPDSIQLSFEQRVSEDRYYYYGQLHPQEIVIRFRSR